MMNNSYDQRAAVLKCKAEEIEKKLKIADNQATNLIKPTSTPQVYPKSNDPAEYRIFVKNLRPETTEDTLKAYFGRWGKVTDVFIRQSQAKYNGMRCNMAYVTFQSYFNVSPVNCYMHVIDGYSVTVDKLQTKPNRKYEDVSSSKTIMITGSIHELRDSDLIAFFRTFGELTKLTRKRDPKDTKKYQRFAFLIFASSEAVDQVIAQDKLVLKGQLIDARRVKDLA